MPSFDVVSEIDHAEVQNALNQANKEIATRFDFKDAAAEIVHEKNEIKLRALSEVVLGKLAKRNVSLKNIEKKDAEISSMGRASQTLVLKEGLEGDIAKKVTAAVKATGLKVQASIQGKEVRVSGKNRDDLQEVMAALRKNADDIPVALAFQNFRE